jgi:WD40 repeat protein
MAMALSADGRVLAGANGGTVALWDIATGARRATLEIDKSGRTLLVGALAFSPDGETLAVKDDTRLTVWDVSTGKSILQKDYPQFEPVVFSPDGRGLVIGNKLWDLGSWEERPTLPGVEDLRKVVFAPDGRTAAAVTSPKGNPNSAVVLYDLAARRVTVTLKGHCGVVSHLAFSHDTKLVTTAGSDRTIQIWNVATGERQAVCQEHESSRSVAISRDGRTVASATGFGVRLWDPTVGQERLALRFEDREASAVAFTPDGQALVVSWRPSRARPDHRANPDQDAVITLYRAASSEQIAATGKR